MLQARLSIPRFLSSPQMAAPASPLTYVHESRAMTIPDRLDRLEASSLLNNSDTMLSGLRQQADWLAKRQVQLGNPTQRQLRCGGAFGHSLGQLAEIEFMELVVGFYGRPLTVVNSPNTTPNAESRPDFLVGDNNYVELKASIKPRLGASYLNKRFKTARRQLKELDLDAANCHLALYFMSDASSPQLPPIDQRTSLPFQLQFYLDHTTILQSNFMTSGTVLVNGECVESVECPPNLR